MFQVYELQYLSHPHYFKLSFSLQLTSNLATGCSSGPFFFFFFIFSKQQTCRTTFLASLLLSSFCNFLPFVPEGKRTRRVVLHASGHALQRSCRREGATARLNSIQSPRQFRQLRGSNQVQRYRESHAHSFLTTELRRHVKRLDAVHRFGRTYRQQQSH